MKKSECCHQTFDEQYTECYFVDQLKQKHPKGKSAHENILLADLPEPILKRVMKTF